MAEPFLGELRLVPYNFAPAGWIFAAGQIMSIAQNTALFSLLGTTYGGNGTSTFALPDMRGRVPMSSGQGPGLASYVIGQTVGAETVALDLNHIPSHNHTVNATSAHGNHPSPIGNYPAADAAGVTAEYGTSPNGIMNAGVISPAGGGQPFDNHQPTLVLNWIIALQGIFPSRN